MRSKLLQASLVYSVVVTLAVGLLASSPAEARPYRPIDCVQIVDSYFYEFSAVPDVKVVMRYCNDFSYRDYDSYTATLILPGYSKKGISKRLTGRDHLGPTSTIYHFEFPNLRPGIYDPVLIVTDNKDRRTRKFLLPSILVKRR